MTIYLKTNWYFICILQLAGLAKVSNMETILCDQKIMADLHIMHVVTFGIIFYNEDEHFLKKNLVPHR